jgi:acyl carrier protein
MGLDTVELAMEIENNFQIRPTDKEWSEVRLVNEIHALIITHMKHSDLTDEEVMSQLIKLIAKKTGNEEDKILPTDSITDDLGLD